MGLQCHDERCSAVVHVCECLDCTASDPRFERQAVELSEVINDSGIYVAGVLKDSNPSSTRKKKQYGIPSNLFPSATADFLEDCRRHLSQCFAPSISSNREHGQSNRWIYNQLVTNENRSIARYQYGDYRQRHVPCVSRCTSHDTIPTMIHDYERKNNAMNDPWGTSKTNITDISDEQLNQEERLARQKVQQQTLLEQNIHNGHQSSEDVCLRSSLSRHANNRPRFPSPIVPARMQTILPVYSGPPSYRNNVEIDEERRREFEVYAIVTSVKIFQRFSHVTFRWKLYLRSRSLVPYFLIRSINYHIAVIP